MAGLKERDLYEPIREALKLQISTCVGFDCVLEDTSREITPNIRARIDDLAFFYIEKDKNLPDLIGYFEVERGRKNIIIVEIKKKIHKIDFIYQTKKYAELFDAKYALLISFEKPQDRVKRLLLAKQAIYTYGNNKQILIATFDKSSSSFEVDNDLYGGMTPEPFRVVILPTLFAFCFDTNASRKNLIGRRVIVKGDKAFVYEINGGLADDLIRNGKVPLGIMSNTDLTNWLSENKLRHFPRPPTREELGL